MGTDGDPRINSARTWFFARDIPAMTARLAWLWALGLTVGALSHAAAAQPAVGTGIRSQDIFGKFCFKAEGMSRPQPQNSRLFDHVVLIKNQCFKTLNLKVCYHNTDRCTQLTIPAYTAREAWLGAMPALRYFQYDLKEVPGPY
jgi:hypothetical protein